MLNFLRFCQAAILVIAITIPVAVSAQGDPGEWCSPGAGGESICRSTPTSACEAQNQSFNPDGGIRFLGTEPQNELAYRCRYTRVDENPGGDGLQFPLASAFLSSCPTGETFSGGACKRIGAQSGSTCPAGGSNPKTDNPITLINGAKTKEVIDWQTADGRLKVNRFYNSAAHAEYAVYDNGYIVGSKWGFGLIPQLRFNLGLFANQFLFLHPDGRAVSFNCCDGQPGVFNQNRQMIAGNGYSDFRVEVDHEDPSGNFYNGNSTIRVTDRDGTVYKFTTNPAVGKRNDEVEYRLETTTFRDGYQLNYTTEVFYEEWFNRTDRYVPIVTEITDSYGRKIKITYNKRPFKLFDENGNVIDELERTTDQGHIYRITLPDGNIIEYDYDGVTSWENYWEVDRRLTNMSLISASDEVIKSESYEYSDSNNPLALTAIIDSSGISYNTVSYDTNGRAISSTLPNNVDRVDVEYDEVGDSRLSRKVTNALGKDTVYTILSPRLSTRVHLESIVGEPSENCVGDARDFNFEGRNQGFGLHMSSSTDKEGRVSEYEYNEFGDRTLLRMATGLPEEVTQITEWTQTHRAVTRRIVPGLTTEFTYDSTGRVTEMMQIDTSGENSLDRTWAYTYSGPNIASIDGPLNGPSDTVLFQWSGPNLTSVTNALGHRTDVLAHNPIGAPALIRDPNGVETRIAYDQRHRAVAITEDEGGRNATTLIAYDAVDNISQITQPDGVWTRFIYDDARRLMGLENSAGESIELTRNLMGGVTSQVVKGADGGTTFSMSQVTDEMNRIIAIRTFGDNSGESLTNLAYDREDNLTDITDPRRNSWSQAFDGLDRLIGETDPLGAETDYDLSATNDARNPLSKVTDARNVETTFARNGFGEVVREISFEAGTTEYEYDTRGLVTRMTDARGVVVNFTYDVAGGCFRKIMKARTRTM